MEVMLETGRETNRSKVTFLVSDPSFYYFQHKRDNRDRQERQQCNIRQRVMNEARTCCASAVSFCLSLCACCFSSVLFSLATSVMAFTSGQLRWLVVAHIMQMSSWWEEQWNSTGLLVWLLHVDRRLAASVSAVRLLRSSRAWSFDAGSFWW